MPTYSEIGAQFTHLPVGDNIVWLSNQLRDQLRKMEALTERPVVVYEANHRAGQARTSQMSERDLESFMDVLKGLKGDSLDLILNSWGGSPDAADMIGSYLRQKFTSIHVYVPLEAMSAATMLACGASEIIMGKHSFLGPIDLQMQFMTPDGPKFCAAQDVLDQFYKIKSDFTENPQAFWDGPGARYYPDTIIRCENALSYGQEVAERGLQEGMFRGEDKAAELATKIAADLANHQKHRAHARRLSRTYLEGLGMKIRHLEEDQQLQNQVLTIHHFCSHWFETLGSVSKTLQSSQGRFAFDIDEARCSDVESAQNMHILLDKLMRETQDTPPGADAPIINRPR